MSDVDAAACAELQAAGRAMLAGDLTWGNAGNLSARTGDGRFVITASGTRLGELVGDDFVECPLLPDDRPTYTRKPSKEMPMHRAIYAARPDISAILHAHPFYSTLIACADGIELPADWFVEDMYYLERVARVLYYHPGSAALAKAVGEQARGANVLLLENHGVIVGDASVSEALLALQTVEVAARMLITARQAGIPVRALPPDSVQDFLQHSGYRTPREWPQ